MSRESKVVSRTVAFLNVAKLLNLNEVKSSMEIECSEKLGKKFKSHPSTHPKLLTMAKNLQNSPEGKLHNQFMLLKSKFFHCGQ